MNTKLNKIKLTRINSKVHHSHRRTFKSRPSDLSIPDYQKLVAKNFAYLKQSNREDQAIAYAKHLASDQEGEIILNSKILTSSLSWVARLTNRQNKTRTTLRLKTGALAC